MTAVGAAIDLAQPEGIRRPFLRPRRPVGAAAAPVPRIWTAGITAFVADLVDDIAPLAAAAGRLPRCWSSTSPSAN